MKVLLVEKAFSFIVQKVCPFDLSSQTGEVDGHFRE